MSRKQKQVYWAVGIVLLLLVVDQLIKVYVKTHFTLGEAYHVFGLDWWQLKFIENDGMAFGMELGPKLILTLFRIFVSGWGAWYLMRMIRRGVSYGLMITCAAILAGAMGNIVDCMFYGLVFSPSTFYEVASCVGFGEGYGTFMHGLVVDMFYFPLFEFDWPSWMPFVGGRHFEFFSAIFNFADACISCGVFSLLFFYHKELETHFNAQANASGNVKTDASGNVKTDVTDKE